MSVITSIKTLRLDEFPNLLWVVVEDDRGHTGLGETFFGARAVEAWIHETAAAKLVGQDAEPEPARMALTPEVGSQGAGVEMRGISAIDIALWDLKARRHDEPVWQAMGGRCRKAIRTYNTCAGYGYVRSTAGQTSSNWGIGSGATGPYEDLQAFLTDAGALARSLLSEGINGMKIWPFDRYAERSAGQNILPAELEEGLKPFRQIRDAVGNDIDIMLEMHSFWNQPAALQIAEAVAPYDIYWIEDAVRMQGVSALADFRARSPIRVTASETIAGRHQFRELLEADAADFVMLDLGWCGGLTEGKAIAALADAWHRPIAPHDCTGPVVYAASCHLSVHARNAVIQESVRALYTGWYTEVADGLPVVADGMVAPAERPGHGITLKPGAFERADATVMESR
ncbi:dehydratase [Zhengella mangrovi]|uniref:Dehydratase n=1 Tax=Zhengella mangrovi TaxID=1982044 RepID=A0A2G1QKH4_9HYPH|nr:mandelate racemase/muconate lactonizing enzyme family protein [Zhengella mangrovi]PHP66027.1 dehydratase [Zhengella mangrovi]